MLNSVQKTDAIQGGYILMELLVALTIFGLSVVGLTRILSTSVETTGEQAFDTALRYGLEAILKEAQHREVREMDLTVVDNELGVTYETDVDRMDSNTTGGERLRDLYTLTATATWQEGNETLEREVWMWIHRPREDD